jgi:hypothetical protein
MTPWDHPLEALARLGSGTAGFAKPGGLSHSLHWGYGSYP